MFHGEFFCAVAPVISAKGRQSREGVMGGTGKLWKSDHVTHTLVYLRPRRLPTPNLSLRVNPPYASS